MANTVPPGNTVVEIQINRAAYLQEGSDLSPEQVCEQYAKELIEILGSRQVTIDIPQLTVRAAFGGQAKYLPGYDHGGMMDGEGDTLSISTQIGVNYIVHCYTYGLGSVKINGEERKAA